MGFFLGADTENYMVNSFSARAGLTTGSCFLCIHPTPHTLYAPRYTLYAIRHTLYAPRYTLIPQKILLPFLALNGTIGGEFNLAVADQKYIITLAPHEIANLRHLVLGTSYQR